MATNPGSGFAAQSSVLALDRTPEYANHLVALVLRHKNFLTSKAVHGSNGRHDNKAGTDSMDLGPVVLVSAMRMLSTTLYQVVSKLSANPFPASQLN